MRSIYAALGMALTLTAAFAAAAEVAQPGTVQTAATGCLRASAQPYYPPVNSPPIAQATRTADDSGAPVGAACFEKGGPATWITVASVVRTADSPSSLIERFGAISQLLSVRYWSTTDHKWRPLVSAASAIDGSQPTQLRADYSPAELAAGSDLYYRVTDTRSGRGTTYRLRLQENRHGRVVVETSNVDAIKQWGITLYAPNGLDTWYFLNESSPSVLTYYSVTRILPASLLAVGHEKSFINRAVALYRHYLHLRTDAEPPSAP
jgi:hypothetical protein